MNNLFIGEGRNDMNLTVKILIGLVVGAVTGIIFNLFAPDAFQYVNTIDYPVPYPVAAKRRRKTQGNY